jgi:hypothetical protein
MANDSLKKKIEAFMDVWGTKLGDSALKAVNDVVDYGGTQETGLQASGIMKFDANGFTYGLQLVGRDGKPYWQYIEYGVDGTVKKHGSRYKYTSKAPPIDSIKAFIEKRGIQPSQSISSQRKLESVKGTGKLSKKIRKTLKGIIKEKNLNSTAYAIQQSIKKKGIKPRPFIDKIMTPELQKELKQGLANIYKEEIISTFKTGL